MMAGEISIGLLTLPRNITSQICHFLDNQSLQQLRLVCRIAKDMTDYFLEICEMGIRCFCVGDCRLQIGFDDFLHLRIWKSHLADVLTGLILPVKNSFIQHDHARFLEVTVNEDYIMRVLDSLKPLLNRSRIRNIELYHLSPDIIHKCSELIDRKFLERISFRHDDCEFLSQAQLAAELSLLQKLQPFKIYYVVKIVNEEFFDFIVQVADIVQYIGVHGQENCQSHPNVGAIIRRMMRKKCDTLRIFGEFPPLSLSDVEILIKDFTHSEKKFHLVTRVNSELMDVQIGKYRVYVADPPRFILIAHLEKQRLF